MSAPSEQHIDPTTLCADCDKPWSEHWAFACDDTGRTFKPRFAGVYPPNRVDWTWEVRP